MSLIVSVRFFWVGVGVVRIGRGSVWRRSVWRRSVWRGRRLSGSVWRSCKFWRSRVIGRGKGRRIMKGKRRRIWVCFFLIFRY